MSVRAGRLRNRITVKRVVRTVDAEGSEITTLEPFCEVWARELPLSGRMLERATLIRAEADRQFEIREMRDLAVKDVIVSGGREYDLQAILEPEKPGDLTVILGRTRGASARG